MKRTILRTVCLVALCAWHGAAHADSCDDLFDDARADWDAANSSSKDGDLEEAADHFDSAADGFDLVLEEKHCRCPKVKGAAERNAAAAREHAERLRGQAKDAEEREEAKEERDAATAAKKEAPDDEDRGSPGDDQESDSAASDSGDDEEELDDESSD